MEDNDVLKKVSDFRANLLNHKLNSNVLELINNKKIKELKPYSVVFNAALEVKKLSAQIDEIVHATGIIRCLPKILDSDETVESLSLASGASGDGFDLVTNKRIAEFKFARWQDKNANGMRKRQVFKDLVNLILCENCKNEGEKKKELYVYDAHLIEAFFKSEKANWRKVLSKSGGLEKKLEAHIKEAVGDSVSEIFRLSNVRIIDIEKL